MTASRPKWLIIQCAALGWNLFDPDAPELAGLAFSPLAPLQPGLTCPAQASFRTAKPPADHGMIANGLYHRKLRRPLFWEQAATQVDGPRIWDDFRNQGGTVGMLFWQQSLGENVDLFLSPRPIHKHSGGMIQHCASRPDDLYQRICDKVGKEFNLMHYWGPLASHKSSEWIVSATRAVLDMEDLCPDLLFTYLPHLDYDTQRHGPSHAKAKKAFEKTGEYLNTLRQTAEAKGYKVLVWGDYAMHDVSGPAIFPNRQLRESGLLGIQQVKHMAYPDLFSAKSFAMVDHEIAHVYVNAPDEIGKTQHILQELEGVKEVFRRSEMPELNHPNAGELIAVAEPGRWFAYPWWTDAKEAPDFATHVDIHNKPGFDACELFFGRFPWQVSQNTSKVGGCHGAGDPSAWACSDPDFQPENPGIPGLASHLKSLLT
ncbi:alkaline phosphatase family protein [Kiritimatiellaeota bacterium B1221]|nr:alkaline phosphatase family protein [Kiritimatiellaeota bacterium B1221]